MQEEKIEEKVETKNLPDAMVNKKTTFNGNPLLKGAREKIALTKEHIQEIAKCAADPIYFAEHYINIVNIDKGRQLIQLYPYQKELLTGLKEHRYSIILSCRQSGKCVTYDTMITIKNKNYNDGKPFSIKIGDFYNWIKLREEYKYGDN